MYVCIIFNGDLVGVVLLQCAVKRGCRGGRRHHVCGWKGSGWVGWGWKGVGVDGCEDWGGRW